MFGKSNIESGVEPNLATNPPGAESQRFAEELIEHSNSTKYRISSVAQ
jgi:hypothetical protein